MPKLNQVIAIESGTKTQTSRELTDAHHMLQKDSLMKGLSRNYQPLDDEGEQYPPESTLVQVNVLDVISEVQSSLTKLFDVTATKEWGNTEAKANITVDGEVILENVPVTYLLFLEKQLVDLHTFVDKLPVLDPSEHWEFDTASGVYRSETVTTNKTKKVPRNHVKAEATDKHPAQVEIYYEDVVVGNWKTVKILSALPVSEVSKMRERVRDLQQAVKFAREEANSLQVDNRAVGEKVLDYIFG